MTAVATAVVIVACSVLLWSGVEKLRRPRALATTLSALGARPTCARIGAATVPTVELGIVVLVVMQQYADLTAALLAGLGAAFAVAAGLALAGGRDISCACFGTTDAKLGWKQVSLLPLWLIAAWGATEVTHAPLRERLDTLGIVVILLVVARGAPTLRAASAARADRRALAGSDRSVTARRAVAMDVQPIATGGSRA